MYRQIGDRRQAIGDRKVWEICLPPTAYRLPPTAYRLPPIVWSYESGHSRPQMRFRGIPALADQRMLLEHSLHDCTLDSPASAMNQPNLPESGFVCSTQVGVDDRRDVGR